MWICSVQNCLFCTLRFNRYMVECEWIYGVCCVTLTGVLIDTWWNVNVPEPPYMYITFIVLIDTWWNVNVTTSIWYKIWIGFNRYMVECEFINRLPSCNLVIVLIDTWWNVNKLSIRSISRRLERFNRYMVECESVTKPITLDIEDAF